MNHAKKIIDALSDNRLAPETLVTNLIKEPLDTQEMFIYIFVRYIYAVRSYYEMGLLSEDMENIGNWSKELAEWLENHLTT